MRRFERSVPPAFLLQNWQRWGTRYRNNRVRQANFTFQWPTHQGSRINVSVAPLLADQTQAHCSYCDNFPLRSREISIDHFRPKSIDAFYDFVCKWENLYFSCGNCQSTRLERFNSLLLRPDATNYSFEKYFLYSFASHRIDINPTLSRYHKRRARITIDYFGLNDPGHIAARRISFERFEGKVRQGERPNADDFPYRFMIGE
jgi:uncharacterized protein (TIGR02646 family)